MYLCSFTSTVPDVPIVSAILTYIDNLNDPEELETILLTWPSVVRSSVYLFQGYSAPTCV